MDLHVYLLIIGCKVHFLIFPIKDIVDFSKKLRLKDTNGSYIINPEGKANKDSLFSICGLPSNWTELVVHIKLS